MRGEVDDRSASGGAQRGDGFGGDVEGAEDFHVEDAPVCGLVVGDQEGGWVDACGVDDCAQVFGGAECRGDGGAVGPAHAAAWPAGPGRGRGETFAAERLAKASLILPEARWGDTGHPAPSLLTCTSG
jgi:hypothetical protein